MRTIREILRQKWQLGRSNRAVARSVGLSVGAIGGTLHRARAAGLATWDAVMALPDDALAARLYARGDGAARARPQPDCASIHTERRQPGVTLQLLHLEYLERHPDGYQYTPYCEVYRQWLRRRGLTMRQVHRAGEKSFVDYAGKRPSLTDPATGERIPVELLEDRTGTRATIVTSQLPPAKWHDYLADPTVADAICDRLLHPAHRLVLKGPSRRKEASPDS